MGLSAMFSSISGLQSDSQWLDVIGNNISNVNTIGYKASRAEFADQLSQTLEDGSGDNPSDGKGGVDPQQVGLGTRLSSIETVFTQGPTINTGISTDISIQGNGFLIAKQGDQSYLTRAGDLTFDSNGYLVDQNGAYIQGFNATLQYAKIPLLSAVPPIPPADFPPTGYNGNPPLFINQASLDLDSQNVSSPTDIQINPNMVLLPKATTEVDFKGNLDAFQQANQPGGILNVNPNGVPLLPVAALIDQYIAPAGPGLAEAIDTNRLTIQPLANGGYAFQQLEDLSDFVPGVFPPPTPIMNGFMELGYFKSLAGDYAWDQVPPVPPADQVSETVYDSNGNPRQITVQFYQINDLGAGGINNPNGPNQVCYAWYAFDTTGGQPVSTAGLLGGTGIGEGNPIPYDRGNAQLEGYQGDFLWFNTDGSLASSGGSSGLPGPPGLNFNFMSIPTVYLPPSNLPLPLSEVSPLPTQGAEITPISLNFGTFGLLGTGERNGLYSDADGSYQVINGVNTYVPKDTVYAASQNGYADGTLESLNIDPGGIIQGSFSNGQVVGLAQVALEQVQNPEGLNQAGNTNFTLSFNTGPSEVGLAGQGNFGTVQDDSLEGSNVDLTTELTNMILAERSFDTNSRMIAVVNETLTTLSQLGQ